MKYNSKTLDELCDVKIGRTPPRNQSEWFNSGASDDWKWVSIKELPTKQRKHLIMQR